MPRHSHQDALTEDQFRTLLDATDDLEDEYQAETYFILVAAGRLGMRGGEIAHMREDWINWERSIITIPGHEPCECGYCRQSAKQSVGYNPESTTFESELAARWKPKTPTSARSVPFDYDDEIEATVTAFFEMHDEFPICRSSINRRVDRVMEAAGMDPDACYPHALRATAATWHAYRGLAAVPLQNLMGWRRLATAQKYIRLSGSATAEALRDAHQD